MRLFSSLLDVREGQASSELELRVAQTRQRAAHEMLPWSLIFGWVAAVGLIAVLHQRVAHPLLAAWVGGRLLAGGLRYLHTMQFRRHRQEADARPTFGLYRALAALDGLAWGAMGWGLTPLDHLEVAIVTICVLVGVAALGASMLHIDMPSASLFIIPILLPNAIYGGLGRHDDLGVFCAGALSGLMVLLLMEANRSSQRIIELLRLRFQSEDVTRAQAEALEQARKLTDAKSRFVATMSHEMRTPLHGILGLIRLLRERENDPMATRQLDLVRSSGDHLLNVISDVLDFARLEVDGLPVHEQRFNLHALISEMTETAQVTASEKGLSLSHRIDLPSGVDVQGDPIRIRQVLHNLLGNAIKFTSAGSVRLHVARDSGGWVCFQVHDTGIGIPVAEQALVFEAFHQAEGTYQRRFGGTGLGLTISRELARAMGGELSCFSEVDQGSVFTLALPLPSVGDVMRVVHSPAQDKVPHVLLVEDNPVNAMVAEAELQRLGVRVTVIDNGRQAVDWLEAQQPDLVLMDCEMPVMDGIETTRCIRERERVTGRSQVDIVALTANGPDIYAGRCQAVGMSDHLSKPFRPDDLARMLSRHLRLNLMPA